MTGSTVTCDRVRNLDLIAAMARRTRTDLETEGAIALNRLKKTTDGKHLYNPQLLEAYQQQLAV